MWRKTFRALKDLWISLEREVLEKNPQTAAANLHYKNNILGTLTQKYHLETRSVLADICERAQSAAVHTGFKVMRTQTLLPPCWSAKESQWVAACRGLTDYNGILIKTAAPALDFGHQYRNIQLMILLPTFHPLIHLQCLQSMITLWPQNWYRVQPVREH